MIRTWWAWPLLWLLALPITVSLAAVWHVAGVLGWGVAGRIAAEVVVHLLLAYPYGQLIRRLVPSLLRPFVQAELLHLVQQMSSPDEKIGDRISN